MEIEKIFCNLKQFLKVESLLFMVCGLWLWSSIFGVWKEESSNLFVYYLKSNISNLLSKISCLISLLYYLKQLHGQNYRNCQD